MLGHILRDPAMRTLPLWVAMSALSTSALISFIRLNSLKSGTPISYWSALLACWCGIAIYLGFGKLRVRCNSFDMTLPVPARRQWLAHVLAVLLAGALIAAASLVVVYLHLLLPNRGIPVEISFPVLASTAYICVSYEPKYRISLYSTGVVVTLLRVWYFHSREPSGFRAYK